MSKQSRTSSLVEKVGSLLTLGLIILFSAFPIVALLLQRTITLPSLLLGQQTVYRLLGFLFIGILIYSLYDLFRYLKNRKNLSLPWIQAVTAIFFSYILFFPHHSNAPIMGVEPNWEVPAQNLTDELEEQQLFPFSNMVAYITVEDNGPRAVEYQIDLKEGEFTVRQNDIRPKQWIIKDIESAQDYELVKTQAAEYEDFFLGEDEYNLPSTMNCVQIEGEQEWREQEGLTHVPLVLGGETHCLEFYYKDKLLFTALETVLVTNVLVSPDEQWMLIAVGYSDVYLVEL